MKSSLELAAEARAIDIRRKYGKEMDTFENAYRSFLKGAKHREAELMGVINKALDGFRSIKKYQTANHIRLRHVSESYLKNIEEQLKELGIE